jgi:putative transposase
MAVWRRGKPDALLHHSDQGSQHTSEQFPAPDSRPWHCLQHEPNAWDNAAMESFPLFAQGRTDGRKNVRTRDEARADVFD